MLDRAKAGTATPRQLFDYYLGYLDDPGVSPHFRLIGDDEVGFARGWGMRTAVEDLRRVVRRATRRGGKVVLGGHSLGGTITTAYATWDFGGRPGAPRPVGPRLHRRRQPPRPALGRRRRDGAARAARRLALAVVRRHRRAVRRPVQLGRLGARADRARRPLDRPGLPAAAGRPQAARAGDQRRAVRLRARPRDRAGRTRRRAGAPGPARAGRGAPRVGGRRRADAPAALRRGVLGLGHRGPRRHGLVPPAAAHDRRGRGGRGQREPGPEDARRASRPRRRSSHVGCACTPSPRRSAARGSSTAARTLARQSGIRRGRVTLVDRSASYAHVDPVSAAPERNAFLRTLTSFLRRTAR